MFSSYNCHYQHLCLLVCVDFLITKSDTLKDFWLKKGRDVSILSTTSPARPSPAYFVMRLHARDGILSHVRNSFQPCCYSTLMFNLQNLQTSDTTGSCPHGESTAYNREASTSMDRLNTCQPENRGKTLFINKRSLRCLVFLL